MPAAHGARLFFAIELPEGVRHELAGWARRAGRGTRVLDAGSLHLTLLFLGNRPFEQIDELAAVLASAAGASGACELSLGAPVWLPPRRPRVLAVEVQDPSTELARLQAALVQGVGMSQARAATHGEPAARPEPRAPSGRTRRFRPHITVARARARAGARVRREFPDPTPQLTFLATQAVLYRSLLEPAGARYEPLASVELAAPG